MVISYYTASRPFTTFGRGGGTGCDGAWPAGRNAAVVRVTIEDAEVAQEESRRPRKGEARLKDTCRLEF